MEAPPRQAPRSAFGPAPTRPHQLARLAVFDFDNTIIRDQTGVIFTRYLLDKGLVSEQTVVKVMAWGVKYFVRLPVRQSTVREDIFSDLTELGPNDLAALAQDFHDHVLITHYRSDALREIVRRQREGCVTLVASATFEPVAQTAARYLKLNGALGTAMEVDEQGHFTGRVQGAVVEGAQKLAAINTWANAHFGVGGWELTYAYGDHHSDMQTLGAARYPVAVNPCFSLMCRALGQHWPIVYWD